MLRAFDRDFEVNGPSMVRIVRTTLAGWKRYKNHPDPRVRARYARECAGLATIYAGALWAAERWLAGNAGDGGADPHAARGARPGVRLEVADGRPPPRPL